MAAHVCYHYPCPDGAYAALSAHLYFSAIGAAADAVVYHPLTVYSAESDRIKELQAVTAADTVYLLDFCGGRDFVLAVCAAAVQVVLIDHHKTAAEMLDEMRAAGCLPANLQVVMAMDHSGAQLAWTYFDAAAHDKGVELLAEGAAREQLVSMIAYVEDNDIWRHALPQSVACATGVGESNFEFDVRKNPDIFKQLMALSVPVAIEIGTKAITVRDAAVEEELKSVFTLAVPQESGDAIRFLALRSNLSKYRSHVGNLLAGMSKAAGLEAMAAVVYVEPNMADASKYKVSLRGVSGCDTTRISQRFGGGGHAGASSFLIDKAVLESWIQPAPATSS